MNSDYRDLIDSSRVSSQTHELLLERGRPDLATYQPAAMSEAELTTLRSVIARIIPQIESPGSEIIDIAARLDCMLAEGRGDGWRYAALPDDAAACRSGLRLLDALAERLKGASFEKLAPDAQDGLLEGIASGRIRSPKLDLKLWFEDLRASAMNFYVAHPETLARMGYSGIADDPNGFVQLGIGKVEAWEPKEQ